jgi:hypothetical protein
VYRLLAAPRWEKGQATGDENIATENLRRFFEQHFHESNDSYAIINLDQLIDLHAPAEAFGSMRCSTLFACIMYVTNMRPLRRYSLPLGEKIELLDDPSSSG